jgi:uncharacterized membrane protein
METGTIISLLAMLISAISLLIKSHKDSRTDASQEAASTARMDAKLDAIASGVDDIRVDMRTMRDRLQDFGERLTAVEQSAKSAHHRLDLIERKGE